jgi:hypothetical protein
LTTFFLKAENLLIVVHVIKNQIKKTHVKIVLVVVSAVSVIIFLFNLLDQKFLASIFPQLRMFDRALAASQASLSLGENQSVTTGQTFEVPLIVNADGPIGGIDTDITFNHTKIQLVSVNTSDQSAFKYVLTSAQTASNNLSDAINSANDTGSLKISFIAFDQSTGLSTIPSTTLSDHQVAKFTFTAIATGETQIQLNHSVGLTTDSNVAATSPVRDILQSVQGLSLTIKSPQQTSAAPTIVATVNPTTQATIRPTTAATQQPTIKPPSPNPSSTATNTPAPSLTGNTPAPTQASNPPSLNHGLAFNGRNQIFRASQPLPVMQSFTAEAILRPTRRSATGIVIVAGDDNNGWSLELNSGRPIFWMADTNGTWSSFQLNTRLAARRWYHLSATYDKGTVRIFLDGNSFNVSRNLPASYNAGAIFQLGGYRGYPHFTGIIDSVRVSNKAIYQSNYSAPTFLDNQPGTTVVLYQLNEGAGQKSVNSTNSNQYLGVLGNETTGDTYDPSWVVVQR